MSVARPLSRTYIINKLIAENHLRRYLEIGVSNPWTNFLEIKCPSKTSVDPCIQCEFFDAATIDMFRPHITHQMTSDEFFAQNHDTFDIVFIDGDHSYEQSLRDLNNALRVIPVGGFVVLHDAMPIDYDATQITNFEKHLPYNGEVWKTVLSALDAGDDALQIGTFPYDFGVTVIKKLSDNVPEIPMMTLDYYTDYNIPAMRPVFDTADFHRPRVSYFTPLYNTPQKSIERTARTVLNQTNPNWEWVLVDDSSNAADAARLEKYFASIGDDRIKYYRSNRQSNGFIGWVKKRAANLCTGDFLAELDHDDLLMPELTDQILRHGAGYDFIYSNNASIVIRDDDSFETGETWGPGFAMGYGTYRTTMAVNPLTGYAHQYAECVACPINPKTIRHIVGVPNHVRIWRREFYDAIGGHNENLWVVDDYELVVRSFVAGGRFLHLDMLGYLQIFTGDNTTDKRRGEIQILVKSILYKYDEEIRAEFERRQMDDWAYRIHHTNFGCHNDYHYWDVETQPHAPAANDRTVRE